MTFCAAMGFCESKGGHLFVIDTEEEMTLVNQVLSDKKNEDSAYQEVWAGLTAIHFNQLDWVKPSQYPVQDLNWKSPIYQNFPEPRHSFSGATLKNGGFTRRTGETTIHYALCEIDSSVPDTSPTSLQSIVWTAGRENSELTIPVGTELEITLDGPARITQWTSVKDWETCKWAGGAEIMNG